MKKQILLHIPEPCHENWDAMTPQDKGRHCQSCNKIVVDFSVMTDRQVLDYFKNAQGNTCGRFHNDQLQRPLIEPQKQPGKWNYFLASVASFFLGIKLFGQEKLQGKVAFPALTTTTQSTEAKHTKGEVGNREMKTISGKVTDEKGAAIAGVSVTIDKSIKGSITDSNGRFTIIATLEPKRIIFRAMSFQTKVISFPKQNELVIVLEKDTNKYSPIQVCVDIARSKRSTYTTGGAKAITVEDLKNPPISSIDKLFGAISGTIEGKITDEKGAAITDASIQIKGTKLGTTSKADGSFELNKLGNNTKLTIVVSSLGYETKTIEVESKDLNSNLNIVLKIKSKDLEELVLNTEYGSRVMGGLRMVCTKVKKTSKVQKIIIKPIQKLLDIEPVKIYPNPVAKNANVHIAIKQTGTWELQLFTVQSSLLSVKEVVINTQNQIIDYTLPNNIVSGNYFLRLVNKETKKVITEKIIVL